MNSIKEEVTQADREGAEDFEKSLRGRMLMTDRANFAVWCAEAFARHRLQSTSDLSAKAEGLESSARELRECLAMMLDHYVSLAGCGDCGHWNPEDEDKVKFTRAVLAKHGDQSQ